jgi:hypothetical protein
VSPVKYELGSYIPEDDILQSHRRENLTSYIVEFGREVKCVSVALIQEVPSPVLQG